MKTLHLQVPLPYPGYTQNMSQLSLQHAAFLISKLRSHAPGRKGHILLQGSDATLERLEEAITEANAIRARCDTLSEQCSSVLAQACSLLL